jgi:hypothetical protein
MYDPVRAIKETSFHHFIFIHSSAMELGGMERWRVLGRVILAFLNKKINKFLWPLPRFSLSQLETEIKRKRAQKTFSHFPREKVV